LGRGREKGGGEKDEGIGKRNRKIER